ncbi:MAG: Beta-barrel assembly-enhancing protease [Steroidobacteraceae bacterium]|nr:Beta-barrel assembly-enhancing protease [Steroidobacteraceae bacterium]
MPDLRQVEALLRSGETRAALTALAALEADTARDATLAARVAETYTHCGRHADARRCLQRAARLSPDDPHVLYNLAAAEMALGHFDAAEALLDRVIRLSPDDFDAWYNRATLRRQSPARNHVAALEAAIAKAAPRGDVALGYALAKELEDLGEYERAFRYLERGAAARRRQLAYRVEADIEAIDAIIAAFDASILAARPTSVQDASGPVFVVGLPRSGTTLVDRILASHPSVESFGELNDLPLAVMRAAGRAPDKLALIRQAARCDFAALGRDYLERIAGYGRTRPRFVDKTPLNFLYLGLIALALPQARVVHLRRDPLDSGYAMLKTLFRMGYPFSYDQEDIARYYGAYARLMAHWRARLPGAFLDLDYEDLVADQERSTRRLLDYCGLTFDPACLAFHRHDGPTATASAAQVREPVHTRSIRASRRVATQLAPMIAALRAQGVEVA